MKGYLAKGICLDALWLHLSKEEGAKTIGKVGGVEAVPPKSCLWIPYGYMAFPILHDKSFPKSGAFITMHPYYDVQYAKEMPGEVFKAVEAYNEAWFKKPTQKADPSWCATVAVFRKFAREVSQAK